LRVRGILQIKHIFKVEKLGIICRLSFCRKSNKECSIQKGKEETATIRHSYKILISGLMEGAKIVCKSTI